MIKKEITNSFLLKVHFIYGCDEQQFLDYVSEKEDVKSYDSSGRSGVMWQPKKDIYVWIWNGLNKWETTTSVYHEVGHAMFSIIDWMHNHNQAQNVIKEEVFLYAQEDMVNQVLVQTNHYDQAKKNRLKKKKDGKKNKPLAPPKRVLKVKP